VYDEPPEEQTRDESEPTELYEELPDEAARDEPTELYEEVTQPQEEQVD